MWQNSEKGAFTLQGNVWDVAKFSVFLMIFSSPNLFLFTVNYSEQGLFCWKKQNSLGMCGGKRWMEIFFSNDVILEKKSFWPNVSIT